MLITPNAEGKTKAIFRRAVPQQDLCEIFSKDDITAGDGKRHDVVEGKGILSNTATVNVFSFLKKRGILCAFVSGFTERSFLAQYCTMLPVEVVIRGVAEGSYLSRNPDVSKGAPLIPSAVEYYYKTSGKKAFGVALPCEDPLMVFDARYNVLELHHTKYPVGTRRIARIGSPALKVLREQLVRAEPIARQVFSLLTEQWRRELGLLVDLKIEFGINDKGELVVADVIDADSWRVIRKLLQLSKEPYRQGASTEEVTRLYTMVADITSRFV